MKICMLASKYPPEVSGPGSFAYQLSQELIKNGHEVTVVTQNFGNSGNHLDNDVNVYRVKTPFSGGGTNLWDFAVSVLKLGNITKKIVKTENIDILHSHDISFGGLAGFFALRFLKIPSIIRYGGDLVYEYLSMSAKKGWDPTLGWEQSWSYPSIVAKTAFFVQKKMLNEYDLVCPNSTYADALLGKMGVEQSKRVVIPSAVDITKFSPNIDCSEIKGKLGANQLILCASRLLPWKGIDTAIEIMPSILREFNNVRLVIAGDGPEKSRLLNMAKKISMEKSVIFLGAVSRSDMPLLFNAADIFLLPSKFESCPNALLEAMSCETPSIATDIKGVDEIIQNGENGYLIELNNTNSLSKKVSLLLSDKNERKRIGRNARKTVQERYSFNKITNQVLNTYNSIV